VKHQNYIPALGYHFLTGIYDLVVPLVIPEKKIRHLMIKFVNPLSGEKILEFGFGSASNLILGESLYKDVSWQGLEIDEKIKAMAEKKISQAKANIQIDQYEGKEFPYPDHQFDAVFCCLLLHLLDRVTKEAALKEIHRVLKPGGRLIIGDWGKADSISMKAAYTSIKIFDRWGTTKDNLAGLIPVYMKEAGFSDVHEVVAVNTFLGRFVVWVGVR
jgi:ubiquinone/menaquinone biosynthesis C-methylase UbiE